MSFIWDLFCRCFQRRYQLRNDCQMEQQKDIMKNLQSSTTFFCNKKGNPLYLSGSGTNSGNACYDTSLSSILSPYHFRNWELDPSTAFSQSFDHCEIFGTFYDNFITPPYVFNQTVSFSFAFLS
ncbi:unnamed protein product [Brugia timori]|uniref:TLDc domain-containing protein n=1 Tax=Brugia timori TaxID=42155 RepID=A0A0R3R829_9BILA|nr:unnamed protein product [Brugia timori]